jgi:hypothetical protein
MFRVVPGGVGIKEREMDDSLAILVCYFEILKYAKRSVGVVNLDIEIGGSSLIRVSPNCSISSIVR